MGTQNLNNYYFNKIDSKLNYSSYYDLFLASDENDYNAEVVWSSNIIGAGDTSVLPVIIDLNDTSSSSLPVTGCLSQYPISVAAPQISPPFTILSKVYWLSARTWCDCSKYAPFNVAKICDLIVADTARSNGLYDDNNILNLQANPPQDCVEIYQNLPAMSTFNKLHFDKRFKMSQVKAYGLPITGNTGAYWTDTSILQDYDSSGYFQNLRGGFYQGFYKLHGYDYEVLPTRPNKGWSFSTYLKLNTILDLSFQSCSINYDWGNCYNTSGYNGISATTLCSNVPPGVQGLFMPNHLLNYSWLDNNVIYSGRTNNEGFFFFKGIRAGVTNDVYSNAVGFRITDDMKIGYRTLRYTADCVSTEAKCPPNANWECGYGVEESYSEPICPIITQSGNCMNPWIQVDVVFERDLYLEDCDLLNMGGINDLIKGPYSYSADNICDTFTPGKLDFTCSGPQVDSWFDEKKFRMGTLKFYINGRIHHTVNNYEEIIPRHTNRAVTSPPSQFGVPYTMSWGGGAWGYRELGTPVSQSDDLISKYFGGSFIGGISQMMYYIKPLTPDEIYHNFLVNRYRYSLIDCEECKNCPGGCPDCDLPSEYVADLPTGCTEYVHLWDYCGSGWNTTSYCPINQYELEFGGLTGATLIDSNLPGVVSSAQCQSLNSELLFNQVGRPIIGDVVDLKYEGIPGPDCNSHGWACFTYKGTAIVTSVNVIEVNTTSALPPFPPALPGALSWSGWVGSGGTAFENCCACTGSASTACQGACTSGCIEPSAINYCSVCTCDCSGIIGGTDNNCCTFIPSCTVVGCRDITATNYNPTADCDCIGVMGGSDYSCCVYVGGCVSGCTDPTGDNYDALATCDCSEVVGGSDYSCCSYSPWYCTSGCTDPTATNYNVAAGCDCSEVVGGSNYSCCSYCPCTLLVVAIPNYSGTEPIPANFIGYQIQAGWTCPSTVTAFASFTFPNGGSIGYTYSSLSSGVESLSTTFVQAEGDGTYSFTITMTIGGVSCTLTDSVVISHPTTPITGCTDPTATNYNPAATVDDGSCIYTSCYSGCTDSSSVGWDPTANCDCASVVGGNDYSCCLSNCDGCVTTPPINGVWNVGQLNINGYGWGGGAFDSTFSNYTENDTVIYNGCCYLCHTSNSGFYFACSDYSTLGAPDVNAHWLTCDSSCGVRFT